ncbi:hypothetical protein NSK_004227 [Nannochloropsis salina CCMP1776]|jgi:hypothetical protein|uniref:E3 UFM1-protein ligase 1-like N-terminal domain-containing protein n=1 Tax=Nannochloropsis salina CCMP1776 TaxID=1027361 RepID=A0A4D9CYY1_9STRA|nr:hypothetical protein NSK_004227 [Nannochloropsis salina CCMP1776]|eukprot:TFJ84236.1 hypothetical protein NSK_004227 [Nannochloropsis salina CCMP1776]
MDEILALQRELVAVQAEDTSHCLSERNCVEIVVKLCKLGRLDVIYTSDGKEILTPEQLLLELRDELLSAGGRLALADVRPLLNVDMVHIQRAAARIVEEDLEGGCLLSGGELIAAWYLDDLVAEVLTQMLPEAGGRLAISTLAARVFKLPVPLTEAAIKARVAGDVGAVPKEPGLSQACLPAKLRNGALCTAEYDERQKARIRGVLAGVSQPITLGDLAGRYSVEESLIKDVWPALVREGVVVGALNGRQYVPAVFRRMQRACMEGFFGQNGYMECSRAHKLQVRRPLEYLRQSFPGAIQVGKELVVDAAIVRALEGHMEDCVARRSWLEAPSVLPPILSSRAAPARTSGAALLLNECLSYGRGADLPVVVIEDIFVVSRGFLQDAQREAEARLCLYEADPPCQEEVALRAFKAGGEAVGTEDARVSTGKGDESNGREGGQEGGREAGGNATSSAPGASARVRTSEDVAILFSEEGVEAWLRAWDPALGAFPSLAGALAARVYHDLAPTAVAETVRGGEGPGSAPMWDVSSLLAGSGVHGSAGAASGPVQHRVEKVLDEAILTLQLLAKGLVATPFACEKDAKEVTRYILKSRGAQLAHLLSTWASAVYEVPYQALASLPPFSPASSSPPPSPSWDFPSITLEQRNVLKTRLPSPLGDALAALWTLVVKETQDEKKRKSANAPPTPGPHPSMPAAHSKGSGTASAPLVLEQVSNLYLSEIAPALDFIPRTLDKKKEKKMLQARKLELVSELNQSESPTEMLAVGLQLLLVGGREGGRTGGGGGVLFVTRSEAEGALVGGLLPRGLEILSHALLTRREGGKASRKTEVGWEEVEGLGRAWREYAARKGDGPTGQNLAVELLEAQRRVKEAFGRSTAREAGGKREGRKV